MKRIALLAVALIPAAAACSQADATIAAETAAVTQPASKAPSEEAPPSAGALTLVADTSQVCMVNNQFMGKAQIPVEVDGNTYYGCCEMCKGRLANDRSSRVAIDPVSEREVDKSLATIGQDASGAVYYFENAENLAKYKKIAN